MSDLVAVAYDSEATAREVLDTLRRLQTEHVVELEDGVVVTKNEDGKIKLHQSFSPTGAGAAGGLAGFHPVPVPATGPAVSP